MQELQTRKGRYPHRRVQEQEELAADMGMGMGMEHREWVGASLIVNLKGRGQAQRQGQAAGLTNMDRKTCKPQGRTSTG